MRIYLKIIQLAFLYFLVSCSSKEKSDKVKLSIHGISNTIELVEIKVADVLNLKETTIARIELDSTGNAVLEFEIDNPTFATIQLGDKMSKLYLEPGFNLKVAVDDNNENQIYFTGIGNGVNNYLEKYSQIKDEIENLGGRNLFELNINEFLKRMDSLNIALTRFHKNYTDSTEMSDNVTSLLEKRNNIIPLLRVQNFGFNYGARNNFDIPESLDESNIPYYTSLVETNMGEYAMVWQIYMYLNYYLPLWNDKSVEEYEKLKHNAPFMVTDLINMDKYPPFMNEYLLA